MYIIKRNGRRTIKTLFPDYELARQYVRKLMRRASLARNNRQPDYAMSDFDYKIVKI